MLHSEYKEEVTIQEVYIMADELKVHKRKATKRFRYWSLLVVLVIGLGIATAVIASNLNNKFEPLVYADTLSSDGITQQVGVDNNGYSVIREGRDGDYQSCEYQLEDIEVIAIQQGLSAMADYFIPKDDAPDLEAGIVRVFYGDNVVVIDIDSNEVQQDLVTALYGPLRKNCMGE